MALQKPYITGK